LLFQIFLYLELIGEEMSALYFLTTITYLSPYGGNFQYGIVLYPVLAILLAIISKTIFKKGFDPPNWRALFIASIGFSIVAFVLFILGAYSNAITSNLHLGYIEADESMGCLAGAMMLNFGSFLFFISYLINFLIRLVRRRKQKSRMMAG
jgi:membrane protein implicated in regulation of membrane protease activity